MFIVIPYLTSNPAVYGIYSVCISLTIFLSYADLGFLGAGQKYAAVHFARGELDNEIETIGFSNFILAIFLLCFSTLFIYFSFYPEILINNIATDQKPTASALLFILAIFTPTTLLQRLMLMVFSIRMEEFVIQRTNIYASILKIASVFWFFREGHYDITGYYLCMQILNFIASVITIYIAKRKYDYNILKLFKSLRFSLDNYKMTKNLAYASLFLTFSWVLYYELDSIAIAKIFGSQKIAIYAIGLTILSLFRNIFGILFSPFNTRFNHFIGYKDESGLKNIFFQVVILFAPVVVIPILVINLFLYPLILSWVGPDYLESVMITRFLIFCNILAFISYPTGMLLVAKERQKEMFIINSIIPFVFWAGIILGYQTLGVLAFAVFKLVAFMLSGIIYFFILKKYLEISVLEFFGKVLKPLVLPILFLVTTSILIRMYLPVEKSKINLIIIIVTSGMIIFASFILQYFTSNLWRQQVSKIVQTLKK